MRRVVSPLVTERGRRLCTVLHGDLADEMLRSESGRLRVQKWLLAEPSTSRTSRARFVGSNTRPHALGRNQYGKGEHNTNTDTIFELDSSA